MKNFLLMLCATFFALGVAELSLRYLPIVDLNFKPYRPYYPTDRFSYRYHHGPAAFEDFRIVQPAEGDGCPSPPSTRIRILFLGDSWMEPDGIPLGVSDYLKTRTNPCVCAQLINGGATSFSPSLYMLAGEELAAKYHPDFVVVNVDETDLMDESLRYKKTALRDAQGKLERVVPDVTDLMWVYGHVTLEQQPLYTLRLIESVYFRYVLMPRLRKLYLGQPERIGYDQLMAPQLSKEPRVQYAGEVAYFEQTLDEMFERLSAAIGSPDRLLVTHHPHYLHLASSGGSQRYNHIVSEIVADEAKKYRVEYYDAETDIHAMYADDFARFFLWPKDPFSHLTAEGLRRYGFFVGKALLNGRALPPADDACH
ncbi:MAG TPA: hypothetical protein VMS55_12030 [Myxococcota bacterium]|nr:hypothetical protein [Myxococcota bacterium]